jgi:hypothetical protein
MPAAKTTSNVVERIRIFRNAFPFAPYEIRTASGEKFRILDANLVAIAPNRSAIVVIDRKDRQHLLSSTQITDAVPIRRRRKRGRRAA